MGAAATPTWGKTLLRWAIVIVVGVGGAYLVRRAVVSLHAGAARRLVLIDYARLEGCLYGGAAVPRAVAPNHMRLLAIGDGDPLWPHSCSPALTRLVHESEALTAEDPRAASLARAAGHADSALGEAVFWNEHLREGRREPARWANAFSTLRDEIVSYARASGATVPPPELRRSPRRPGREVDAARIVPPRPLDGGDEADIVDAIASTTEFAVLMRDRRSNYGLCRIPMGSADPTATCSPLIVPPIADPRDVGFVPSERMPHLAMWARAPVSTRGILDVDTLGIQLLVGGNPDGQRDVWAGAESVLALQIAPERVELLAAVGEVPRHIRLPRALDVVVTERALLGTPRGGMLTWIDARARSRATLRALPVGLVGPARPTDRVAWTWVAPHMTGITRRLLPCAAAGDGGYVAAADDTRMQLFATHDGVNLERLGAIDRGATHNVRLACGNGSVAVAWPTPGGLDVYSCGVGGCLGPTGVVVQGAAEIARTADGWLVADAGGADGALRVRAVGASSPTTAPEFSDSPARARSVRLLAHGADVAAIVAAERTFVYLSRDAGRTFRALRIVETQSP